MTGAQRLLEVGLLLSSAVALLLLIALFTFDPHDPGWSQSTGHATIHNAAGSVGAWLADLLLFVWGWIAFTIPFLVAFIGWLCFRRAHAIEQVDFFTLALRVTGFVMMMLACSALASMNFDDVYYFSSGGVVGDLVSQALIPILNLPGTVLLLLATTLAGFTLSTGISLIWVSEKVGAGICVGMQWLWQRLRPSENDDADEDDGIAVAVGSASTSPMTRNLPALPTVSHANPSSDDTKAEDEGRSLNDLLRKVLSFDNKKEGQGSDNSEIESRTKVEPKLDLDDEFDDDVPWDEDSADNDVLSAPTPLKTGPAKKQKASPPAEIPAVQQIPTEPFPSLALLDKPDKRQHPISQEDLDRVSRLVEQKLADFNVEARVVAVSPGPVITRLELDLAPGVKVSKITNLSKDLARSLSAMSVRVVEVIPGKSYVGLEIPNKHREIVRLSEVLDADKFKQNKSVLTMVLGADISGAPVVVDLAKMPHLLVAGTTGSGKSVGVNVMITSLLYKSSPEDVRFIMIDPKMLELSVYEGIPHLLCEVVTDMKEAANALRWCVGEMERRYKLMSALGVRNLKGYNAKIADADAEGECIYDPLWKPSDSMAEEAPALEKLPSIVVVVDEFADMMMIVGKKVEELIARIAQKARAAGIHLILATQRPSVDVITGLIKANIPTRIAFQVSSRVDSRTILDQQGAEHLLGQGDMLYLPPGSGVPTRVHGAFIDDHEVHAVVADWQARGKPQYLDEILNGEANSDALLPGERAEGDGEDYDPLYDEAVAFVTESRRGSISSVQRKLKIGYNRAARIIEQMEADGVVSPPGHNGNRDVLAPAPPK